MLVIRNICKKYKTGDLVQTALNNVSLNLRDNEFVSILGPSGSGKTTLLNIIGGLDRYDSGDLIINNVSTKNYKDRDYDTYRNHTIGFVFQSYNLIPHQSILSNVELALTIAGISKKERRLRAKQALDKVGLKDQYHKKPNQMSGGQMQRVAIARALVNNPSIVLADEPTGALDSKTSVQVMELLKEVAKDRLVVMVTHNPELAENYSNRIIKLNDGEIVSDSNPYILNEIKLKKKTDKVKKARMSIFTSLSLSFNNLLTKKGRTILTAFAGSIGIIGIALILSLSQGFQNYIDKIQEDTLTSYPLTITSDTADVTTAILSMVSDRRENKVEGDRVRESQYLTTMFSSIGTNDLRTFKAYLQNNEDEYGKDVSKIKYSYSISPTIYSIDAADNLVKLYPSSMWNMLYSNSASSFMSSFSSAGGGMIFSEMSDDLEAIYSQYDVLSGRWPSNYDEVIIVLSEPNSISDLLVYSLGLRDTAELKTIISKLMSQEELDIKNKPLEFSYDDLLNLDLRLINQTDTYKYNDKYDIFEDMSQDEEYMLDAYDKALKLKVVGIVCPKENKETSALSPGVNFTSGLTQHVIDEAYKTDIVKKQLNNKDVDVFSHKKFDEENKDNKENSKLDFEDMISVDEDMIKDAFKINVSEDDFKNAVDPSDMEKIITDVVTKSGMTIANEATNLVVLNSACLNSFTVMYDGTFGGSGRLMLSQTDLIAANITGEAYKAAMQAISAMLPEDAKALLDTLTDADYDLMAKDVKTMFTSYYDALDVDTYKQDGDIYISIDPVTKVSTYGTSTTITSEELTRNIAASPSSSANTTSIINRNIANKTISLIAEASANTAAKTAALVAEGIGSLFGEDMMSIDTDKFAQAFKFDMDQDELSRIMETIMSGSEEKSYKSNLISLGYQDVDDPTSISFFFENFDAKENFMNFLDKYNENATEETEIKYTDITGILMSSVKTIVDSVTYVLIAFVSISLVVSSIMIAVITLISVMERTKEIGILRAMGASKHNVSSIFNAETFIIGLLSGLLGVGVTFLSIPPINGLIHNVTGNYDINAVLPSKYAIILVLISVVLTIFAGIIPSRKASKQDPVIALRTE